MKSYVTAGLAASIIIVSNVVGASAQTGPAAGAPGAPQLVGSEWAGTENLKGYAKLRFQFLEGGQAFMIDNDGKSPGRYVQNGAKVSLSFYDDKVLYVGTISGQTMSGSAQNGKSSWTFKLTREGGTAAAPTAAPAPVSTGTGPNTPVAPIGGGNVTTGPVQSGPAATGPVSTGPATGAPASVPANRLTPENLPEYLRKTGYQVKVMTPATGPSYCVLTTKNDAGWTFVVEVRVVNNAVWLVAPLSQVPASNQVASSALIKLLEANNVTAPCFFLYRAADKRICLKLEVLGGSNSNSFRSHLTLLCNNIQQSYAVWTPANLSTPAQPLASTTRETILKE